MEDLVTDTLDTLLAEIRACRVCEADLPLGPRPVVVANPSARILIIGQAPGTKVHESGIPWNDRSGDTLRGWLEIDKETFYDPEKVAIVPMGFCYPGVLPRGGDAPPRPECAPLWHGRLRAELPNIKLTLLAGMYAQAEYLGKSRKNTLTATVEAWREYGPEVMPLPHPSWRSENLLRKNPWFEAELLPDLRARVRELI
ncbi:MAG: uracil-DNA glycosylase family protein [Alphaproteobacteria bacterium]|nr:uracil-DNA glycosylase family protein [Alphaproteobacteria bacterium]